MPSFFIFFAKCTATSKGVWLLKAFHLAKPCHNAALTRSQSGLPVGSRWVAAWHDEKKFVCFRRRAIFSLLTEKRGLTCLRRSWSSCEWFQLQCFDSARRERSEDLCAVCLSEQNKAKCFQLSVAWISPWEGRFQRSWECGNIEWDDAKKILEFGQVA